MKDKTKAWIKAAGIRAIKTMAQTAIGVIGSSAVILSDVNWVHVGSAAVLGAVLSLLTSLAGLPEIELLDIDNDIADEYEEVDNE